MKPPIRTCVGCGAKRIKSEMIRVGVDNDGRATISSERKHAGRGSYVCPDDLCVDRARKNGGFCRALRGSIPASTFDEIELEIRNRQKVSSG